MSVARFIAQSHKDIMDATNDLKQKDGKCDITGNYPICVQTDGTRLKTSVFPDRMNNAVATDQVDSDNSITVVRQYVTDVPIYDEHDADGDDEGDGRKPKHIMQVWQQIRLTHQLDVSATNR